MSDENQMTARSLCIVLRPTLFQTDGPDVTGSEVVEEQIQNYCSIFNVSLSLISILTTTFKTNAIIPNYVLIINNIVISIGLSKCIWAC